MPIMDEELINKGIDDVVYELTSISDSLKTDRKYYDEELGNSIKAAVVEAVKEVIEAEAKLQFYDPEISGIIKNAIGEVAKKISAIKIDLSPIAKVLSDITDQYQEILKSVLNIPKPEANDLKYQEIINAISEMNKNQIELFQKMIVRESPVIKLEKKKQWDFYVSERDSMSQRISQVTAIEK